MGSHKSLCSNIEMETKGSVQMFKILTKIKLVLLQTTMGCI